MRGLIIKSLCFALLLFLFFSINTVINVLIFSKQKPSLGSFNVLIAGDSHPLRSLNPELFKNAVNISQRGEPYVLTYWKLKKVLNNYLPDTLILGYSTHNLSSFNDLKFSEDKWSVEMFKRCYPIQELSDIDRKIDVDYKTYYKTFWKNNSFYPYFDHIKYIGSFSKVYVNNPTDWKSTIEKHYYWKDSMLTMSVVSMNYLDSIVNLATSKNIYLVLSSSPVHSSYYKRIPQQFLENFEGVKKRYTDKVIFFDKRTEIYPDSLFINSDHLNYNGSIRYTESLIDFLMSKK